MSESSFLILARRVNTRRPETKSAEGHRSSITNVLRSDFGMTGIFPTGSFGNGTSVTGYSDVDYFAVLPASVLNQDSGVTLAKIAERLRARYPNTGVRVDSPGIRLPFGDGDEKVEVIPVWASGKTSTGHTLYGMPDGVGAWMHAAPDAHNAYVRAIDMRLGGKLKPLIRVLKAWNFYNDMQIRSFYLEMYAAGYAASEKALVYDIDFVRILKHLNQTTLQTLGDPLFSDGRPISPCKTDTQFANAVLRLPGFINAAERALAHRNSVEVSCPLWDKVFANKFPNAFALNWI